MRLATNLLRLMAELLSNSNTAKTLRVNRLKINYISKDRAIKRHELHDKRIAFVMQRHHSLFCLSNWSRSQAVVKTSTG